MASDLELGILSQIIITTIVDERILSISAWQGLQKLISKDHWMWLHHHLVGWK